MRRPVIGAADLPLPAPPPLKRRLLRGLFAAWHYSGTAAVYVYTCRISGAVILMYHSVAPADTAVWIDPRNHVPAGMFERQVRFLARRRRVISMSALVDALGDQRRLPAGTVVLTFDDGYLDNLTVAAPLLKRYGMPATLYLPTGDIARGAAQWVDRLYTMFQTRTNDRLASCLDRHAFDLAEVRERLAAYYEAVGRLIVVGLAEREALLASISDQLAPRRQPPRLTMTWDDVRRLRREYPALEIGVHTADHLDLSAHDEDVARAEIARCVSDVERELDCRPAHFSFPYSRSSERTCKLVQECGLSSAVASGAGGLVRVGADRFSLPRIAAPRSMSSFRFLTSGAYPGLPLALIGRA